MEKLHVGKLIKKHTCATSFHNSLSHVLKAYFLEEFSHVLLCVIFPLGDNSHFHTGHTMFSQSTMSTRYITSHLILVVDVNTNRSLPPSCHGINVKGITYRIALVTTHHDLIRFYLSNGEISNSQSDSFSSFHFMVDAL